MRMRLTLIIYPVDPALVACLVGIHWRHTIQDATFFTLLAFFWPRVTGEACKHCSGDSGIQHKMTKMRD